MNKSWGVFPIVGVGLLCSSLMLGVVSSCAKRDILATFEKGGECAGKIFEENLGAMVVQSREDFEKAVRKCIIESGVMNITVPIED